jgi:protein SCO1/2
MDPTRNWKYMSLLLLIGAASFSVAALAATELGLFGVPRFSGTTYADTPPAPDFRLTDHTGTSVSLSDFRGRAALLFFGYTRCPDVCPMTLSALSRVVQDAAVGEDQLAILFVSVDPDQDTPDRLAQYVRTFRAPIVGLTGDALSLQNLLREYGVYAEPSRNGDVTITHSTQVFGIDAVGRLRVLIHGDSPPDRIRGDLMALLEASRQRQGSGPASKSRPPPPDEIDRAERRCYRSKKIQRCRRRACPIPPLLPRSQKGSERSSSASRP